MDICRDIIIQAGVEQSFIGLCSHFYLVRVSRTRKISEQKVIYFRDTYKFHRTLNGSEVKNLTDSRKFQIGL